MPYLSLTTNLSLSSEEREKLLPVLSKATMEATHKPEQYVMVELHSNPDMLFAGSREPLAHVRLFSIAMNQDYTARITRLLTAMVGEQLQIPAERVYVELHDVERHMWGWNSIPFGRRDDVLQP